MQNTARTAASPKVIEADDPSRIPIKTVKGRIPHGSYTIAKWASGPKFTGEWLQ
jgi:hypothetical protein